MEERQLNYNQPFLSVRRFTSTLASEKNEETDINKNPSTNSSLPNYISELKSGPVSHPGTVPFMWEKSPGRSKYENEPLTHSFELPSISRRLPPGRVMKVKDQSLEEVSEISTPTSFYSPRFASNWLNYSSLHEIKGNTEALKDEAEEKESSDSLENDEAYEDALETLSRTESLFSSCGFSGWSGLDEPEVKQSGISLTDPQTRDFMMGRFLPAAKEIVCDSTRPAYRKLASEAKEKPRLFKDVMYGDGRPLFCRPKPNILPNNAEVYREVESENEDDYYDFDVPGNLSTRSCGLLPSFCLSSNGPGVRVRKFALSRRQIRSSFATSTLETIKEGTGVADQEQRYSDQYRKPELCDYVQSIGSINRKLDGSSLYTRLQGAGIPTREDKLPPQSRFYIDGDLGNDSFNSEKRCTDAFEKLSGHQRAEGDLDSRTSMFEETLYVDPVCKVASPEIESLSSKWRELEDTINTNAQISKVMGTESRPYSGSRCIDLDDSEIIEVESEDNSYITDSQFLIPPPSLKTPSESWLWRTLPSMSSKISTSGSNLGKKVKFPNHVS